VVGRVGDIRLDAERYEAVVTMNIGSQYKFPRDTFAKIRTSGLLGEQYIGLAVGGDIEVFKPGDAIKKTESAMVLEDLVGQFLFDKAAEGNDKK
jgi:phospholipid/cholesterol/gamma-HCH transport system substrate-binding protein